MRDVGKKRDQKNEAEHLFSFQTEYVEDYKSNCDTGEVLALNEKVFY